jgi:hypothetical protein
VRIRTEFPAEYGLRPLDFIDRRHSRRVFEYDREAANGPVSHVATVSEVDVQQELHAGPIIAVTPDEAEPWIGLFYGFGYGVPPALDTQVLTMPDRKSFAVIETGDGVIVRADEPATAEVVDLVPITDVAVVTEHAIIVFADFSTMAAYGETGFIWRSERLAWDDVKIVGVEGTTIHATGFDAPDNDRAYPFTVDLLTGASSDRPYW